MVGEGAVHLVEQRHHVIADLAQRARRDHAGHAVAAIHHHLERTRRAVARQQRVQVGGQHVARLTAGGAVRLAEILVVDAQLERLDGVAGQGGAVDHDLEAVVVRRVVAAGDHHPGIDPRVVPGGEIQHRRGHHAQVHHRAAAGLHAFRQGVQQGRAGQAAVTGQRQGVAALAAHFRTDGAADQARRLQGQGVIKDAADVVGAEQGVGKLGSGKVGSHAVSFTENVGVKSQERARRTRPRVEASSPSRPSPVSSTGTMSRAITLPISTPHWSNGLMPHSTDSTNTLCS